VGQKTGPLLQVYNFCNVYVDDAYQNAQFFVRNKTGMLNFTTFKYYLVKFTETVYTENAKSVIIYLENSVPYTAQLLHKIPPKFTISAHCEHL